MQVRYQAALRPEGGNYNRAAASTRRRLRAKQIDHRFDLAADVADVRRACAGRSRGLRRIRDDLIEAVARPADREALIVEQFANAAYEKNFVVLVIAAVAAPLHRLQLRE